jgi:hypothetical protein
VGEKRGAKDFSTKPHSGLALFLKQPEMSLLPG